MTANGDGLKRTTYSAFFLDSSYPFMVNLQSLMKPTKSPFQPHALLWWVAIISLVVSIALYFLLGAQAEIDVGMRSQRMIFPLVGIVIAGVCLIAGTAGRWFYPK